jgi:hypothetical protein
MLAGAYRRRLPQNGGVAELKITWAALALVLSSPCFAGDRSVQEVSALDGNVQCRAYHDWGAGIGIVSSPCDSFVAPSKIEIGGTFKANGKERIIGVVRANQAERDIKWDNLDVKKGEWTCVAGETPFDLDQEHNHSALWLYVRKCQIVSEAALERIIEPVPASEFLKLPETFQGIYIAGLMEGMSYTMYGYSIPGYSDWVRCVRNASLGETTKKVVSFIQNDQSSNGGVSLALARTLKGACKDQ